jgi:hypothetical protein
VTPLLHPRKQTWSDHFERQGLLIVGKTDIGRTIVRVLDMNSDEQLQLRDVLRGSLIRHWSFTTLVDKPN